MDKGRTTNIFRGIVRSPLIIALCVAGFLSWPYVGLGEVANLLYWNNFFRMTSKSAPTDVVVVNLDGALSNAKGADFRSYNMAQARLLEAIVAQQPKRVYLDLPQASGVDPVGDAALYRTIEKHSSTIAIVNRTTSNSQEVGGELQKSDFEAPPTNRLVASSWVTDFNGFVLYGTSDISIAGHEIPALASDATGKAPTSAKIYPDWSVDPRTIRKLSGYDVLHSSNDHDKLAGLTIFVTSLDQRGASVVGYMGKKRQPSVMVDIAAISMLRSGNVLVVGHWPLIVFFVVMIFLGRAASSKRPKVVAYSFLVLVILTLPAILSLSRIIATNDAAIFAALVYGPLRFWEKWRTRVKLTNAISGLPNVEALCQRRRINGSEVIAATIAHYEQMMASLPGELHGECARQIARRLALGSDGQEIFDGSNGNFVWTEPADSFETRPAHLHGLKALFSAPLLIGSHTLDTNIHFGIDRNLGSQPLTRIKSAIASACEAQAKGRLCEEFGQKRLALSSWELSLHARIDEALRNGDIWLAFQAQYDYREGRIAGAEALIRWTDPQRGAIPPSAFIVQAEKAGRIDTLTYWVLEQTILASRELNRDGPPFYLSINLSARMIDQPGLIEPIQSIVTRLEADCSLLTVEVTETFGLTNRDEARKNLARLRAMGFRLSIDDFGTGEASLAYLAEIESDEIKLDRRFIQPITAGGRERVIVESLIRLVHSLDQHIVAEGVEDLATFETLRRMGCDLAQGYFIGHPVGFKDFVSQLSAWKIRNVRSI